VETIHVSDECHHRIDLTPILDEKTMEDLTKDILIKEGWVEKAPGMYEKTDENKQTLVWDLEKKEVVVKVEKEKEFNEQITAQGGGGREDHALKNAQELLRRKESVVRNSIASSEVNLKKEATKELEATAGDRQKTINKVIQKIYSEALQKKASSLGRVMSVDQQENDRDYELVIRVEEG
jgi:type II secretory ATPase GspE/PulE/Tfp pilus assembly ATPase PilB-like protein